MDGKVQDSLQNLIKDVLNSEIYKEYQKQLALVKEQPELKTRIDEFRTRNLALQTGENTTFEQLDSFEKEYAGFRENPLVADFLAAELALCRLLQKLNRILIDAIDFE